jgi:hypothetical protein
MTTKRRDVVLASESWSCPVNATVLRFDCWGAGGNGSIGDSAYGGGGGGGGGFASASYADVALGTVFDMTISTGEGNHTTVAWEGTSETDHVRGYNGNNGQDEGGLGAGGLGGGGEVFEEHLPIEDSVIISDGGAGGGGSVFVELSGGGNGGGGGGGGGYGAGVDGMGGLGGDGGTLTSIGGGGGGGAGDTVPGDSGNSGDVIGFGGKGGNGGYGNDLPLPDYGIGGDAGQQGGDASGIELGLGGGGGGGGGGSGLMPASMGGLGFYYTNGPGTENTEIRAGGGGGGGAYGGLVGGAGGAGGIYGGGGGGGGGGETDGPPGIGAQGGIMITMDYNSETPCYDRGTQILCVNADNKEQYIPIEQLREGGIVKTYRHGYRRIQRIVIGSLINDHQNCYRSLWVLPKQGDMIADLIVTGRHSILVNHPPLTETERSKQKEAWGVLQFKIDDKYMVMACVSDQFHPFKDDKLHQYYHLILEDDGNADQRYGIWANGVLSESQSLSQANFL